ncbi:HD domain-containing protein [candidate division KSB1 bacterium]|nr:HD domain-containing protein [candidate division KSB1 bacterium]
MRKHLFKKVAMTYSNEKWKNSIQRKHTLYPRKNDIRSDFFRDYNRILHCTAYRRLKRKTQVFFATSNDHICTRIEHVHHVVSVSRIIANYLGLNSELTDAIAVGHDLGHAPFGHAGESFLKEIARKEIKETFWHEKNSLYFVDNIETLEDPDGFHFNLDLTYAVRDGIICHCGEVDDYNIFPRNDFIELEIINEPNEFKPYTWEGCVVKIADKISYLGRDIEDALTLKLLTIKQIKDLIKILKNFGFSDIRGVNNTLLMHEFIIDLCKNSNPNSGIRISEKYFKLMDIIKKFSNENIYSHQRLTNYKEYAKLVINSLFYTLKEYYSQLDTLTKLKREKNKYPLLISYFIDWIEKYSKNSYRKQKYHNSKIYNLHKKKDYLRAILDFISGMSDNFALKCYYELISF